MVVEAKEGEGPAAVEPTIGGQAQLSLLARAAEASSQLAAREAGKVKHVAAVATGKPRDGDKGQAYSSCRM